MACAGVALTPTIATAAAPPISAPTRRVLRLRNIMFSLGWCVSVDSHKTLGPGPGYMNVPNLSAVDVIDDLRAALHRDPKAVAEGASRIVSAARQAGDAATVGRGLAVL